MPIRGIQDYKSSGEATEEYFNEATDGNQLLTKNEILQLPQGDADTTAMHWQGPWSEGEYIMNDVVLDDGWTMVANATTTDKAAPVISGNPESASPVSFTDLSQVGTIISSHIYTFSEPRSVSAILCYIPVVNSDLQYFMLYENINTGENSYIEVLPVATGWMTVKGVNVIATAGAKLKYSLVTINHATDTVIDIDLAYAGAVTSPVSDGEWNTNNTTALMRLSDTDIYGSSTDLRMDEIVVGTSIRFTQQSIPANTVTFVVTEIGTVGGTSRNFYITQTDYTGGDIPVGENCSGEIINAVPVDTDYGISTDWWLTNTPTYFTVEGGLEVNEVIQSGQENNAFGITMLTSGISHSDDWDVVAASIDAVSGQSLPYFNYEKVSAVTNIPDTYTNLITLANDALAAGTYVIGFVLTGVLPDTNDSLYMQFGVNGANTEFVKEPADQDDSIPFMYQFPYEHAGGNLTLTLDVRKEDTATAQLDVSFADVICQLVKY